MDMGIGGYREQLLDVVGLYIEDLHQHVRLAWWVDDIPFQCQIPFSNAGLFVLVCFETR